MKIGKVFAKLHADNRVANILFDRDENGGYATVILETGLEYEGDSVHVVTSAAQAHRVIRGARPKAKVVGTKTVTSLMSGKPVTIAANTPRCCDPSTELYWSM